VATVFALALLDPGAPLALGLERALPVRIIRAATVEAAPTRAAALAVLGLATASVVALALRGRRGWSDLEAATLARPTPTSNGVPGGWARGLGLSVAMVAWGVFAWAPIVSLAQPVVASWAPEGGTAGSLARSLAAIVRRPGWYEPVATGAIVGALVAVGSLTMAGWGASGRAGRIARWAGRWVPPLGLAVGLLNAGPALVAASEQASWLGWLGAVGRFIDPYATFGTALVLGLLLVHRPRAVAAVAAARARCGPELVEVGVTLGASGRQARRDLQRPLAAPTRLRAGLLIGALAAADVGLALPLTPMSRPSMPAVAVLDQFDETGGRLAAAVLGLTIAAVAAGAWVAGGPIEPRPEP
jgi:iron(III) transport system permease protein